MKTETLKVTLTMEVEIGDDENAEQVKREVEQDLRETITDALAAYGVKIDDHLAQGADSDD